MHGLGGGSGQDQEESHGGTGVGRECRERHLELGAFREGCGSLVEWKFLAIHAV